MASVKLEYGDPEWMLSEGRRRANSRLSVDAQPVFRQLRRIANAVSSFFI